MTWFFEKMRDYIFSHLMKRIETEVSRPSIENSIYMPLDKETGKQEIIIYDSSVDNEILSRKIRNMTRQGYHLKKTEESGKKLLLYFNETNEHRYIQKTILKNFCSAQGGVI